MTLEALQQRLQDFLEENVKWQAQEIHSALNVQNYKKAFNGHNINQDQNNAFSGQGQNYNQGNQRGSN